MSIKLPKTQLYTAICVVIVLVAGIIVWAVLRSTPAEKNREVTQTNSIGSIKKCENTKFICYYDYLTARVAAGDPATAIADLRGVYETDSYVKAQCHQLTHVVGHAALEKYSTVKEAFTHGDSFCWSGYYHGVVEEAIQKMGADKIKQQANDLCSDFVAAKKYSFDHFNCVHGMGHGFMAVEDLNLFSALGDCDLLHDNWERVSCYGGVYMENIMSEVRSGSKSQFLKDDQPMYPCTAVGYKYKEQCYLMQTSYALQHNQYNFADVFSQCGALVDKDFIDTCYRSAGRDASGNTASDVARTKANCDQAKDQRARLNCALGAVRDFISYYHSDTQGRQLCLAFSAEINQACQEEATRYYSSFR